MRSPQIRYDVLIIGSGAAGLSAALRLPTHLQVGVLAKADMAEGSTLWAQGGIAAVLAEDDSAEQHIEDTLTAGAGLCNPATVHRVVERGPEAVRWLIDQGVPFTTVGDDGATYHLTREGGHSRRRILHAADATGRAIETTLEDRVRAAPNIEIHEHTMAVDLITHHRCGGEPGVRGAYVLAPDGDVRVVAARSVVLATGGASKTYLYTTNPDLSSGDGIAMAWRAGCRVANMEFNQFHPTCLFHREARNFLISEAVRGEGGRLLLPDGTPFMHRFDERAELAPRDIVARAIDHEMKRLGVDYVLLDISHKPAAFIREHFPTIHQRCLEFGFDMTREPLPVVPAAHYTCGGVMVDLAGRTDLPGLYAAGEVTCSGLHGANRMASNSLLECVVFGQAAADDITRRLEALPEPPALPPWDESRVTDSDEEIVVTHNWDELRRFMWDYVGIVRTDKRLQRARHRTDLLRSEIQEYYGHFRVSGNLLELRNLATVADLIIASAMARRESRGLHFTRDHPEPRTEGPPADTVLIPDRALAVENRITLGTDPE
ncbi:L-aspartate oxidase [Thiohalospira sp.]|uniref:L-aspartate oxidase n=1 Tax=Thiohalospira sp. TaxID=3080549 RepID=UPI0039815AC9